MYINGAPKDKTAHRDRNAEKTSVVSFNDGDVLKFQDEGGNAVLWIGSIEAICGRLGASCRDDCGSHRTESFANVNPIHASIHSRSRR